MNLGLDGDAALVTGGSSGLGKASAIALAREGCDVAICARNADRLEAARDAVENAGDGTVVSIQADITDDQGDLDALVEETVETFDGLDHLVVSTGGPAQASLLETNERDWYVAYDLLVMSLVRLAWQSHEHLAAGDGGSITVVGCTDAREVADGFAVSSALRRATVGVVQTLARELAPAVRANAVLAGPHETPYLEEVIEAGVERGRYESDEAGFAAIGGDVPLEQVGDPATFGSVAAFLASEQAAFVTGAALPVDGGALLN